MQFMMDGDLNQALVCFDDAKNANTTQLLIQRGMTQFLLGNYEEAASQFKQDVDYMENKNLKLFKATDARLWWSAFACPRREVEAKMRWTYNDELEETRYLMQVLLRYYHGDAPLEELMQVIGDADDRDGGNNTMGTYLALYLTAQARKTWPRPF